VSKLLSIINELRQSKGDEILTSIKSSDSLSDDLNFDSLDLAELTVIIEKEFGVDIFEKEIITSIGEIKELINE
tara:strand:- start:7604 stop:7825 length:222 start_codon:yes stop_codon:yes gene_type:complete